MWIRHLTAFAVALCAKAPALAAETQSYTYDAKGRLVKVARSGTVNSGITTDYVHDQANNRQNVKVSGVGGGGTPGFTCQHSIQDVSVSAGGTAVFTISRSGTGCESNVEVYWRTQNGSATAGTHFYQAAGTVEFQNPGVLSKTFSVATIAGSVSTPLQFMVKIEVSNGPPNEGAVDDTAVGTISP